MKDIVKFFSVLIGLILFLSCAEEKTEDIESFDNDAFSYIEFGTECGWCAGQEFIKITVSKVEYTRVIPCGNNKGTFTNERGLTNTEWKMLTNSFDFDEFIELEYNNCNVCVDGCDEIIRIGDNDSLHEIRYTPGKEIVAIETLKEKLFDLMQEFKPID